MTEKDVSRNDGAEGMPCNDVPLVIASRRRGNLGSREDMRFFPFTSFRVRMTGRRLRSPCRPSVEGLLAMTEKEQ